MIDVFAELFEQNVSYSEHCWDVLRILESKVTLIAK